MHKFHLKIKTSIMVVFTVVIFLIVSTIMFFQYKSTNDFAMLTTQKVFNNIADKVIHKISTYDNSSENFIKIAQNIKESTEKPSLSYDHTLLPVITEYIKNAQYVYAIYLGFSNDDFYIVYNLDLSPLMRTAQKAPEKSRWLIKRHLKQNNKITAYKTFVDENFNVIDSIEEPTTYQATQRPWYKYAMVSNKMIKTDPYIFSAINQPGITYSQTIDKKNGIVLSLDITLSSLNEILSHTNLVKGSAAFLFRANGNIIGQYDDIDKQPIKNITDKYKDLFIKNGNITDLEKETIVTIDGNEYIKYTTCLQSDFDAKDYLTIVSPLKTIMAPYNQKIYNTLGITVIILVVFILPIIFFAVRLIVKPILELEQENKKIQNGKFDDVQNVDTFMIEISNLSESMVSMANSIEQAQKTLENKVIERTQELENERGFINTVLNSQENFVITSDGKFILSANRAFLDFFNINDIDTFRDKYGNCICDTFNKNADATYIQKDMNGVKWIEYILERPEETHKTSIIRDNDIEYIFTITAANIIVNNQNLKVAVFTDVTEIENVKKEVEKILANILLPVLITSKKDRKILYANKYAEQQYDKPLNEIIGSDIDEVYTIQGQHYHIVEAIQKYGFLENSEEVFKTTSGKEFTALLSVTPITYNSEDCYIGMVTDITKQKHMENEIRAIHKHTRESIEYASLIQSALIPDNTIFHKYFKDSFVIWHPKDTVGGDIYFFEELRHNDECLLMFIDCTGHGVPGAFVTMLVKAIERQLVAEILNNPNMDVNTAWIMQYFNRSIKKLLKQEHENSLSNAGFDGGIIYYNKKDKILKFTGAETPLFYVDLDGKLNTIKGNRYSVGYKKCDMDYEYKESIINVQDGMKFYCTTDGYLDQNGGEKDFPFGKKKFSTIIENYHDETMADQQEVFLYQMAEYESMIENNDRNDDMTVIGFKI